MDGDRNSRLREPKSEGAADRAWGAWATAAFGLAVGGDYVLTGVMTTLAFVFPRRVADSSLGLVEAVYRVIDVQGGLVFATGTITTAVVGLSVTTLFIKLRGGMSVAEYLGLLHVRPKVLLVWLGVAAGATSLALGVGLLFPSRPASQAAVSLYSTAVCPPLFWLAVVIFAPAFEECFFRGFLFEGLRRSRIGVTATIAILSTGWTLLHATSGVLASIETFVFGIALGAARLRTGSLWAPLLMHALWNSVSMILVCVAGFSI